MKAGVTPVLSARWWKANKGVTLKSQPLEGALAHYEATRTAFEEAIESPNADGYAAFMAAKTALAPGVVKAVDAHLASANKTLHKDAIAGLNKYKTSVIPAEKAALDKAFNAFKSRHEAALGSMLGQLESYLKALQPIAELSARTILECEARAPDADKALGAATVAKSKADKAASDAALRKAVEVSAFIAGKHRALLDAVKGRPKQWPFDKSKAAAGDLPGLRKLGDRKSVLDGQIENNLAKVEAINKKVQGVMSQARRVAEGSADAQEALVGAFDRIVGRAFALAQTNDVPAREMKSAISNLDGDLAAYAGSTDPQEKAKHKSRAEGNLRIALVQRGALKTALDKGDAEITGLLDSLPKNVVNRQNPAFAKMFGELDKARKSFDEDRATLKKESDKLSKLEAEAKKLA